MVRLAVEGVGRGFVNGVVMGNNPRGDTTIRQVSNISVGTEESTHAKQTTE
jgi:hypothetical protein